MAIAGDDSAMRFLSSLIALAVGLYASGPVYGWSRETHMTTGAIAFDHLERTDPALLAKVMAIAAAHPDRARFEANLKGLTGRARERATFEWLARWPDDIRKTPYDQPKWHYELRVISPWAAIWPFRNGTASEGFDQNFRTLANAMAKPADRAVALGWLLHIVGDIQQPLHAGHWASWTYPLSDRAGTLGFVRKIKDRAPIELHEFWDQILDRAGPPEATSRAWAQPLQQMWPRARLPELGYTEAPQARFAYWLEESLALARRAGYRDAFLNAARNSTDAPMVSLRYHLISRQIAQRRVATSGYRIADTLRMAFKAR
jgi:hypothetical protein